MSAPRRYAAILLLGMAMLWVTPGAATPGDQQDTPWTLEALMQGLARQEHRAAWFSERRYLSALSEPLDLSGTLAFIPPDRLEKITLAPRRETLVVEGDHLTLAREAGPGDGTTPDLRHQSIDLGDHPEIAAIIESIRATLAGNQATLTRVFDAQVEGDSTRWALGLVPRDERVRDVVRTIRIGGSGGRIETIDIEQADGDRSVMTVDQDGP